MIDYLKIYVKDQELIRKLNQDNLLTWSQDREGLSHIEREAQEGIIKATTTKTYKGIIFCFKEDSLIIYFKPHYHYNKDLHNANDFPVIECIGILKEFLRELQIEQLAEELVIQNIEYGLNVLSPMPVEDMVTFFAYHKKNEFKADNGLSYSKKSYSLSKGGKASRYQILKVYGKGIQFPKHADHDALRFEIKSQESRKIKSLGIRTIKDLLNPETYDRLTDDILARFDEVLILDNNVDPSKLSPKNKIKLVEMLNSHYWYKQQQKTRNTFQNSKKVYFKLLDKAGYNIHRDLKNIFQLKIEELKNCAFSEAPEEIENCAYSDIYIMRNCTITQSDMKRRCVFIGTELEIPEEEIIGKTEEEIKVKVYIENYTVALYKKHLEDPQYLKPRGRGRGKYYYGEDVEVVIKRTLEEVKELFEPYFKKFDFIFNCRQSNYFYGGSSVVGWSETYDLLLRFQLTFFISRRCERKKGWTFAMRKQLSC